MTGDPKLRDGSWNRTAVRSLTVREYQKDPNNPNKARPKPEVLMKGDRFQIFTGAQVTRKRNLTFKGVLTAIYEAGKTWGKTFWFFNAKVQNTGRKRRDRNAVLNAGQKFDRGVNKLVEDMANGEKMSDGSPNQMEFKTRMDALYEQAKILKVRGKFSDDQIAERFRVNLMESLRALHGARGKAAHDKVLNDLTKNVLPKFKDFVGSPTTDEITINETTINKDEAVVADNLEVLGLQEMRQEEQTFNRSVVVAGLRDAATFGSDEKKFKAFGGSRILHDYYGGDADLLEAFNGDHLAAADFNGNADAYRKWGGCAPLYKEFGSDPDALAGKGGAKVLREWLNKTYGQGSGEMFLEEYRMYKAGVNIKQGLPELGASIQRELGDYKGLGYNHLDLKPANAFSRPNDNLLNSFGKYFDKAGLSSAFKSGPTLKWLVDIETLRRKANDNDYDEDTLRNEIKDLARKIQKTTASKSQPQPTGLSDLKDDIDIDRKFERKYVDQAEKTSDVNVSDFAREQFQREIARQAKYKFKEKKPTFADSLNSLNGLKKDQLLKVLNKGLLKADDELRNILRTPLSDFGDKNVANKKTRLHNRHAARLIDNAYGLRVGKGPVRRRLESKRKEALDDNRDKTRIDGRDLRIIEKELHEEGFVLRGLNQAPKRNKPGPELQIMAKNENLQRNERGQIKADIGDDESPIDGRKDAVVQLTGGYSKDAVIREFDKLSQENSIHLDSSTKMIVKFLNRISEEGKVAARFVRHLPYYVNELLKSDAIQKNAAYTDLKHILQNMKTNLEKAAAKLPPGERFVLGVDENFLLDDDDKTDPQNDKNDPGPVDDIKTDIKSTDVSTDEPDKIINPKKREINLGADESHEIDVDPAELKKDINPKQHKITLDGKDHLINRKREELSQDLEDAGNNNVGASKHYGFQSRAVSPDFAIDIENGIVRLSAAHFNDATSADLAQGQVPLRPQDVAFITGAFSAESISSQCLSGQVTFLNENQNAFSHPDMAKGTDPDNPKSRTQMINIDAQLDNDGQLTGHYEVTVVLTAHFDQIKMSDGQIIDADPNSAARIKLRCEVDCTKANDQSGGSINAFGYLEYQGAPPSTQ